jgi:hypothetical protein
MNTPFRLANEVDLTGFGDTGMRLGDLDGDGELEAVFFQARDCHIPRMSAGGYRHEKQVHCITAMKLDGDVMWQEGAPLGTGHWAMHEVAAAVSDIDGDGRPELLMVAGKDLVVLDAATGEDRWIFEGTHIQTCTVGNFLPDQEGQQLFLTERRLHATGRQSAFAAIWSIAKAMSYGVWKRPATARRSGWPERRPI